MTREKPKDGDDNVDLGPARRAFDRLLHGLNKRFKRSTDKVSTQDILPFDELDHHSRFEVIGFLMQEFLKLRKDDFPKAHKNLLMLLYLWQGSKDEFLTWWVSKKERPATAFREIKEQNFTAYDAFLDFLKGFEKTYIQVVSQNEETKILKFKAFEQEFELAITPTKQ